MKNTIIKLLGGHTQNDILLEQKIIKDLKDTITDCEKKMSKLPEHILFKYGLADIKGFMPDEKTMFVETAHLNINDNPNILFDKKTLIVGNTGCGKDWMINKMFEHNRINSDKILFIGFDEDFEDKYGYLSKNAFSKFDMGSNIDESKERIFISASREPVNIEYLKNIVTSCLEKNYLIVFNEIFNIDYFRFTRDTINKAAKQEKFIVIRQTLDKNIKNETLSKFDTIVTMQNSTHDDMELFNDIGLKDFIPGEFVLYEKSVAR